MNLIPLKVECHSVPHLKAFKCGEDITGWQGWWQFLKVPIFLHTEANERNHLHAIVYGLNLYFSYLLMENFDIEDFISLKSNENYCIFLQGSL